MQLLDHLLEVRSLRNSVAGTTARRTTAADQKYANCALFPVAEGYRENESEKQDLHSPDTTAPPGKESRSSAIVLGERKCTDVRYVLDLKTRTDAGAAFPDPEISP